jgi:hypothetical protein
MDDFNEDDFDDLFGMNEDSENEGTSLGDKIHRLMFINDLELHRSSPVPLDPHEFETIFGAPPSNEDLRIMSQVLITDIHKFTYDFVVDKWGLDWIEDILQFNVLVEEYELCSIFKEVLDISRKKLHVDGLI